MVRIKKLLSRHCCGGPVLAMTLLCLGFGALFILLSAGLLGLVFIAVGGFSLTLCLYLGSKWCIRYPDLPPLIG
jgi:hypothetical protein